VILVRHYERTAIAAPSAGADHSEDDPAPAFGAKLIYDNRGKCQG
jgi:hypothetical protein